MKEESWEENEKKFSGHRKDGVNMELPQEFILKVCLVVEQEASVGQAPPRARGSSGSGV